MIFVVGIALAGYAIPQAFGGNGYLSVYIVGIVIGNMKDIYNKRNLVNFFDGTTGLMQVLIFSCWDFCHFHQEYLLLSGLHF